MFPRAVDAPAITIGGAASTPRVNVRAIVAGVASVLAALLVVLSVLTFSAHSLLLDTDRWVAVVGPLVANPDVQAELSTYLADEIVDATGVQARFESAFPNQPLISQAVGSAMDSLFQRILGRVIASSAFQQTWVALNRVGHAQLVGALRGDPESLLTIKDGTLYLDLTPLIARGMDQLRQQVPGLATVVSNLPARDATTGVDDARQDVGAAVGRQLPADFGMIPLVQSDQLPKVQTLVKFFDLLVIVLPLAAIALAVLSVYLVTHRARMIAILGAEVALAFVVLHVASNAIVESVMGNVGNGALEIARAVVADVLRYDVIVVIIALLVFVFGVVISVTRPNWASR
jgi:hypothetical protein